MDIVLAQLMKFDCSLNKLERGIVPELMQRAKFKVQSRV
jgi:hypothetical protein